VSSGVDWREDPRWRLASYDEAYWKDRGGPPMRPTDGAELAQPDSWASLYVGDRRAQRIVATWYRVGRDVRRS
jgi:hypothetical protein